VGEGDQIREYQTGVRCLRASDRRWGHTGSFRCGANVWTLLEVKRTLAARHGRVDPKRLTLSRHTPH
jgi:hypothetical protein